jgi:hypothetical protein
MSKFRKTLLATFLVCWSCIASESSAEQKKHFSASSSLETGRVQEGRLLFRANPWGKIPGGVCVSQERVVDLNQDGNDDIVFVDPSKGTVWVMYSDGIGHFRAVELGSLGNSVPYLIGIGNVMGDTGPNVIALSGSEKRIRVGTIDQSNKLHWNHWGRAKTEGDPVLLRTFRFDADQCADLLLVTRNGKSVFTWNNLTSNCKDRFVHQVSGQFSVSPKDILLVGDIDGDRTDEYYAFDQKTGKALIGNSNSSRRFWQHPVGLIHQAHLARVSKADEYVLLSFYGDYRRVWRIFDSRGLKLLRDWAKFSWTLRWEKSLVGDVNGDGLDDLILFDPHAKHWWIAFSDGVTGVIFPVAGKFPVSKKWEVISTGDFNGDALTDIAALDKHDGAWWVATSKIDLKISPPERENQPQPCIGYNPGTTTKWGRLYVGEFCPPHYAYFAMDDNRSPWGECCPLPAKDILTDTHIQVEKVCPENYVITGAPCIDRCEGAVENYVAGFRCTRINTDRYRLAESTPGVYWGLGFSASYKSTIGRNLIPAAIRHAIGRHGRFFWDTTDGCIGYPFGSLLVEKALDSGQCEDMSFRQLEYTGQDSSFVEGTPVKMYPDCVLIDDKFSPHAKCIYSNTQSR